MASNRPTSALKWPERTTGIKISISEEDLLKYKTPNSAGQVSIKAFAGKKAIVIRGRKERNNEIVINQLDEVWTVEFSHRGVMPSVGVYKELITLIIINN